MIARVLVAAAASVLPLVAAGSPAYAAAAVPPACEIERSGPLSVTGRCPAGFYWVTAHCEDWLNRAPEWVRHATGDARDARERVSLTSSCRWHESLRGGEVFNASSGESIRIRF